MDLRKIRFFVAAAQEENFHRAALRLRVAQPSLSRHIKDLEDDLQVSLFERRNKRVHLTTAGRAFLAHACQILADLQLATERTRQIANGLVGTLNISFNTASVCYPAARDSIADFQSAFQHLDLRLHVLTNLSQVTALLSGDIDAAFVIHARGAEHRPLEKLQIGWAHWLLALPASHPLADKEEVQLQDLKGERLIWTPREQSPSSYDGLIPTCVAAGLKPHIIHSTGDHLVPLTLASSGLGVTFTASPIIDTTVPLRLVFKRVREFDTPLHVDLMWRRDNKSPLLAPFIDRVKARAT